MEPLTPEQTKQLASWVSQRDSILLDIANLRTEQEKLTTINKNLAESNTEIETKVLISIGRLKELDKQESESVDIISTELANSRVEKTQLETQKEGLRKEITVLTETKNVLVEMCATLKNAFDGVLDRVNGLDVTIGNAVKVNNDNVRTIENLLVNAGGELQKIIDVNAKNVEKTNIIINELPRIIFDLQRDIVERKKKHIIKI